MNKMYRLTCNKTVRIVNNIEIRTPFGCSLVNNGHDDLFDQGFTDKELEIFGLKIEEIKEKWEN